MSYRKHKFDPKKCQQRVIAQFEDAFGNKVALLAHHAFKWAIYKDIDGRIIMMQMPREEARQEYKKLEISFKPKK